MWRVATRSSVWDVKYDNFDLTVFGQVDRPQRDGATEGTDSGSSSNGRHGDRGGMPRAGRPAILGSDGDHVLPGERARGQAIPPQHRGTESSGSCFISRLGFYPVRARTSPTQSDICVAQVTVSKLHKVLEKENLEATEEISPGYQLVEVKCRVPTGEHLIGTQALSEHALPHTIAAFEFVLARCYANIDGLSCICSRDQGAAAQSRLPHEGLISGINCHRLWTARQ